MERMRLLVMSRNVSRGLRKFIKYYHTPPDSINLRVNMDISNENFISKQ